MDVNVVTQIISNLGFPIACCVIMFIQMNKEREAHEAETKSITEAINNNTLVLTKLCERLER